MKADRRRRRERNDMKLGIQLYTVREDLGKDCRGTLEAIAGMGYKEVEFAGVYGGFAPGRLSALLGELGLLCCGLHLSLNQLLDPSSEGYAYAEALESPFVTTSLAGEVERDWNAAIAGTAQAGEIAAKKGKTFSYHHHAKEFARTGEKYALDLLLEKTDPAVVKLEADTYWIHKGGEDPVRYLRGYAGRVPQLHLKDVDPADGSSAEVGAGSLDIPAILAAAEDAGVRWVIVEQDHTKRTPLESARMSAKRLLAEGVG